MWVSASLCRHELRIYSCARTMFLLVLEERRRRIVQHVVIVIIRYFLIYFISNFFRTILLWTVFHSVPPGVDTDDDVVRWSWSWRSNGGANHNLFSHKASWWDSLQLSSIASSPISSCIINNTRGVYDIPFDHYHYPTPSDVDILFNCNNHHVQGHGYIKR